MKLLLTRHGKTKENIAGIVLGQNPGELSDEGIAKALELKEKLKEYHIDAVYSSDLKRCIDTSKLLTANTNIDIKLEPRYREINFGHYQGRPYSAVKGDFITQMDLAFPGGESNNQLIKRVIDATNELLKNHKDQTVLVVTHSGPISVINAAVKQTTFSEEIDNKADHNDIIEIELINPLEYPR